MGLIRGTLMLGTGGLVSGSSKKQRVAKAQLRELRTQTQLLEQIADPGKLERERAAKEAKQVAWQAAKEARQAERATRRGVRRANKEARQAARREVRLSDKEARQANRTPLPSWLVTTFRVLCWMWVIFFAIGSLGVIAKDGVSAVLVGIIFSGVPAVVLWKTRKASSPRTAEGVPASQEPTR